MKLLKERMLVAGAGFEPATFWIMSLTFLVKNLKHSNVSPKGRHRFFKVVLCRQKN